jgi:ABC-type transport system involved in multi-copper enzyme maturation permease subunit
LNIKNVARVASITFEENYRKKFLYILLFLSCLVVLAAFLFDPFDIGQQLPVVRDLSLTGLSIFSIIITFALFLTAIPNEIEKKTIYPLLSKPLERSEYLWGKFLGNMALIFINIFVLSILIIFLLYRISLNIEFNVLSFALLVFVESGIIGALIVLFSPFMSYPVNLVLTLLFYISGNVSQAYVNYLSQDPKTQISAGLVVVLKMFLPNFEYLHIKNSVVHSYILDPNYISGAALYGVCYILMVMLIAGILFQRKDL